jgi:hypothetical protein
MARQRQLNIDLTRQMAERRAQASPARSSLLAAPVHHALLAPDVSLIISSCAACTRCFSHHFVVRCLHPMFLSSFRCALLAPDVSLIIPRQIPFAGVERARTVP